jgi:DNA polymerase III subunit delta'
MLIGHEGPWQTWRAALAGERMHHGWLLTGKAGLGKSAFALAAARELVGGGAASTNHPDIHLVSYGPRTREDEIKRDEGKPYELARGIKIGQVRQIQTRLTTRPTLGDKRAVIIDPADDLELSAANALLKSLEEPPAGTYFLLVCHNPSRLLPTIRSRCRVLRFAPLDPEELARFLGVMAGHAPTEERAAASAAAAGSPGAALAYADMGLAAVAKTMRHIRDSGDESLRARGELAALIGSRPDRDRIRAVLALAAALVAEDAARLPAPLARRRVAAHTGLERLTREFLTYNYDPGLLSLEIGNLLAGCAAASDSANA